MTFDIKDIQVDPEKQLERAKAIVERAGNTKITSVSLSKDFRQFMDDYNISPTEAVRKGVAIILFERGLPQYKSDLNAERFLKLKEICKIDQMRDLPDQLKQVEDLLKQIRGVLL